MTKSTATAEKPTTARKSTASKATKPAAKPASKPAAKKPAAAKTDKSKGVTLQDLAAKLDREPKSLRASIRRIMGGPQVGKGGRYTWPSWEDKGLKALMADLTKASE